VIDAGNQPLSQIQGVHEMKKFVVSFLALAAMSLASAASSYNLRLFKESIVAGTTLQPGEYNLRLDGDKATISRGKTKVEVSVKQNDESTKFNSTSVRYTNGDGKYRISEIRLGGTSTTLVVN
jgi:hypothetical protein